MSLFESAQDVVGRATGCPDHPSSPPSEDEWLRVVAVAEPQDDWETDSACIIALKDGRFLAATEWSDSTGHGCQCDGSFTIHDTLEDALALGVTDDQRQRLVYDREVET